MAAEHWRGWLLAAPATLITIAAFLAPILIMAVWSLFTRTGTGLDTSLSLDNYLRLFTTPALAASIRISVEISVQAVVISIALAYPLAYVLAYRVPTRWQRILLILAVLPFWTSYVVRSYAWLLTLAPTGVVNDVLIATGLIAEPIRLGFTRTATLIGFVHFFLMLNTLVIYASLVQIDRRYRLAARDLGASRLSAFLFVTLPLSLPGLSVAAFLTFVLAIGDYITPQILGGGNELTLPQAMMFQISRRSDFPMASAMALVLTLVVLVAYAASAKRMTMERA